MSGVLNSLKIGSYLVYYDTKAFDNHIKDESQEEYKRIFKIKEDDVYISKIERLTFLGHNSSVKEFKRVLSDLKPQNFGDNYFVYLSDTFLVAFFVNYDTGAYDLDGTCRLKMSQSLPISRAIGRSKGNRFILKKDLRYYELEDRPKDYHVLNPKTSYHSIIDVARQ